MLRKCGNYLDSTKECTCTSREVRQYISRISGPLLDRIDIQIEIPSVKYDELDSTKKEEPSHIIRYSVKKAREIQQERYKGTNIYSNSQLLPSMLNKYCRLDPKGREILRNAFEKLGMSARAHHKILKIARTIADMEGSISIKPKHLAEAIQYRSLDRKYWS